MVSDKKYLKELEEELGELEKKSDKPGAITREITNPKKKITRNKRVKGKTIVKRKSNKSGKKFLFIKKTVNEKSVEKEKGFWSKLWNKITRFKK